MSLFLVNSRCSMIGRLCLLLLALMLSQPIESKGNDVSIVGLQEDKVEHRLTMLVDALQENLLDDPAHAVESLKAFLTKESSALEQYPQTHLHVLLILLNGLERLGRVKEMKPFIDLALEISKAAERDKAYAFFLLYRAQYFSTQGDVKSAHNDYEKATKIAEIFNDDHLTFTALKQYSEFLSFHSHHKHAIELIRKAYAIYEKEKKVEFSAAINSMGNVFGYWGDYESALKYYLSYYKQTKKIDDAYDNSISLYNIGFAYQQLKVFDEALYYYDSALAIANALNDSNGIAHITLGRAMIYLDTQKYAKASKTFEKCLSVFEANENHEKLVQVYFGLAASHFQLDNVEEAKIWIEKALQLVEEKKFPLYEAGVYELGGKISAHFGLYQDAYGLQQKFKQAQIEKSKIERNKEVNKLLFLFENEKAEKNKALLLKDEKIKAFAAAERKRQSQVQYIILVALTVVGLSFLLIGIIQRKNVNRMKELANIDELTKVFNRRAIMNKLHMESARAIRYQFPLSLAILDIDHFKGINDKHGHACGDAVLEKIARIAMSSLRNHDIIGRVGGEEFLVIMPHTEKESAFNVLDRMRTEIASTHFREVQKGLSMTISAGVSQLIESEKNFRYAYKRADEALYDAKSAGRNCVFMK